LELGTFLELGVWSLGLHPFRLKPASNSFGVTVAVPTLPTTTPAA
jgi:hypothetical protein